MSAEDRFAERPDYGDDIDQEAFEQILEMDDEDETREFSKQIVLDFFDQAKSTFSKMDQAVKDENLEELGNLGHFLKGSSATVGLIKIKEACEKIQNWGHSLDEHGHYDVGKEEALRRIKNILPSVKADCRTCERVLVHFYRD